MAQMFFHAFKVLFKGNRYHGKDEVLFSGNFSNPVHSQPPQPVLVAVLRHQQRRRFNKLRWSGSLQQDQQTQEVHARRYQEHGDLAPGRGCVL